MPSDTSSSGSDYPKRRRWDEDYDALAYQTDEFGGGEKARLLYEDFNGDECAATTEVGEIMSHNSWLQLFGDDGSGDDYYVRPDGVVLLETWQDEEITEVGRCIKVRSLKSDSDRKGSQAGDGE